VRNGRMAGPWMVERASGERGTIALLVTDAMEPLALAGKDPMGLWKILRGM